MVIVGMLVLRKEMDQNLGKVPGVSNVNELQKIILQGTACILRRFLTSIVKFINNSIIRVKTNQWAVFVSHVHLCKPQYESTGLMNYQSVVLTFKYSLLQN